MSIITAIAWKIRRNIENDIMFLTMDSNKVTTRTGLFKENKKNIDV